MAGSKQISRRKFLIGITSAVSGVGATALVTPFLLSMSPSARALAAGAPVEVNLSKIAEGQLLTTVWRGKPVWIVHRTDSMLEALAGNDSSLRDPASTVTEQQPSYAQNPYRSREPKYAVLIGICTHLGCSPSYRPELAPADLGTDWKGGWYCPCHGSRFDLAGRVYKNVPAATNLVVPPYYFINEITLLIGEDSAA
ncbi:ubiquinol-cytochrome c reductase iron-sulfur subunit [uncultured Thiothrix sp.]|jgi:ubiquinol-cytochrome c reductase iron-sulfur subunit|uniref:ubiquinol-cytochrome c reductase iron-sulfur subunit n=1 Tax=uncultured Thiothrix sp. TaxID=223185 RepID=UPI002611F33A|nr:ubiquinol-cytochrome c reductase iron-sulfur subunit [uncultured Thiothrix sp.]HMT94853.1 ubiquinol-cytochrome c reductase iron-sulfur subunit [Thiolinea sp.]